MTEQWAITLATIITALFAGLLSWIACELRALRVEMKELVTSEACANHRAVTCDKIEAVEVDVRKLEDKVMRNSEDIVALNARVSIAHGTGALN